MTDDQAEEIIGDFTQEAWGGFVSSGTKAAFLAELGALHGEREERIFESAWKLGFGQCLRLGRMGTIETFGTDEVDPRKN